MNLESLMRDEINYENVAGRNCHKDDERIDIRESDTECPVCGFVPRDRIYRCEDEVEPHNICRSCYEQLEAELTPSWFGNAKLECPECGANYKTPTPSRNFLMEEKIEAMSDIKQACLYKKRGCEFSGNRGQLRLHEEGYCEFRPVKCPIQACFEVLYGEDAIKNHLALLHDIRFVQATSVDGDELKVRLGIDPGLRRVRVHGVKGGDRAGLGDVVLAWKWRKFGLLVYSVIWLEPPNPDKEDSPCLVLWNRLQYSNISEDFSSDVPRKAKNRVSLTKPGISPSYEFEDFCAVEADFSPDDDRSADFRRGRRGCLVITKDLLLRYGTRNIVMTSSDTENDLDIDVTFKVSPGNS